MERSLPGHKHSPSKMTFTVTLKESRERLIIRWSMITIISSDRLVEYIYTTLQGCYRANLKSSRYNKYVFSEIFLIDQPFRLCKG